MSLKPIFQLSILSQNDPGCAAGDKITASVLYHRGGNIYLKGTQPAPPPRYPVTDFPLDKPVLLPIPQNLGSPTPTWFMEISKDDLNEVVFIVEVKTPGQKAKIIILNAGEVGLWAEENKKTKTNQIYKEGDCGIFGFAQLNIPEGQPAYFIYTITAGVDNPKIHPPK
jgi:hypothetical protein